MPRLICVCLALLICLTLTPMLRAEPMSDETYSAGIKPGEVARRWPEGRECPKSILDLALLIKDWRWGSVGHFSMPGGRFNDYWIEGGADLHDRFGMFLHLPEGTEIALWYHDGAIAGAEPVVEIGSEGALNVLAPNLKAFMIDWAEGRGALDLAFDDSGDYEDLTPEKLADRKRRRAELLAFAKALPDAPAGAPAPDLQKFVDGFAEKSRAAIKADPVLQDIAKLLTNHIPRGKKTWEVQTFWIAAAGSRIEIVGQFVPPDYKKRAPVPEHDALVPLIAKAREARAAAPHQQRGLWHSANLILHPDGHAEIRADWDQEPKFHASSPATKAEIDADLARFPRAPRWIEPWMTAAK